MVSRTTVGWMLALGLAAVTAACGTGMKTPGTDRETDSTATIVKWTDGQDAIRITCALPGGCQTRALAMCKGKFTPLSMDNMPTRGDMSDVRGQATVVVRCTS
jgi:hypothetical protein